MQPVKIKQGPRYSWHTTEVGWLCLSHLYMTSIKVGILYSVASQISFTLHLLLRAGLHTKLIPCSSNTPCSLCFTLQFHFPVS